MYVRITRMFTLVQSDNELWSEKKKSFARRIPIQNFYNNIYAYICLYITLADDSSEANNVPVIGSFK